jgi:4-amino-4-deoxy-L-arabinose transferase-like glycosyltransferase
MVAGALRLREPLEPLTRRERIAFWIVMLCVALTRWPAVSRTLWDWDEALFALALRDYDVTAHHPHPPGFPLWIGMAKLLPFDAFHSLQTIAVTSSLLVFPAMFFLGRELRARAFVAMAAGLFLAFFPNVWFFGGTAFSDVPSMVLALFACALLLRGCRDPRAFLLGGFVLGIAAGFRPQNLLIGFAPFAIAFFHRRRTGVVAALIVAIIVIASFGTAASLSGGWSDYRAALQKHEEYIRNTDSFLAPRHPGLLRVADDFFVRPYRAPVINVIVTLLALLGLRRTRMALFIFGPFLLFAWLYLDFHSASRFSIAYMPLFALLAAEGLPRRGGAIVLALVVVLLMVWTWPALRVAHTTIAPPVAALQSIPRGVTVYVDERLAAHAELLIPVHHRIIVRPQRGFVLPANAVLVREGASIAPRARVYKRERDRLAAVARERYFEVSVIPSP